MILQDGYTMYLIYYPYFISISVINYIYQRILTSLLTISCFLSIPSDLLNEEIVV